MSVHELRPRKKPPVDEGCDNGSVPGITDKWARGIIAIHEGCEPACPRKATALRYLADTGAETEPAPGPPQDSGA